MALSGFPPREDTDTRLLEEWHTITYTCGHREVCLLFGPTEAAIAIMVEQLECQPCPECRWDELPTDANPGAAEEGC